MMGSVNVSLDYGANRMGFGKIVNNNGADELEETRPLLQGGIVSSVNSPPY